MNFTAVSKFHWRSKEYESGSVIEISDSDKPVAERMVKEGLIKEGTLEPETPNEPAAKNQSKSKAETVPEAGDVEDNPAVIEKKSKQKSKRTSPERAIVRKKR